MFILVTLCFIYITFNATIFLLFTCSSKKSQRRGSKHDMGLYGHPLLNVTPMVLKNDPVKEENIRQKKQFVEKNDPLYQTFNNKSNWLSLTGDEDKEKTKKKPKGNQKVETIDLGPLPVAPRNSERLEVESPFLPFPNDPTFPVVESSEQSPSIVGGIRNGPSSDPREPSITDTRITVREIKSYKSKDPPYRLSASNSPTSRRTTATTNLKTVKLKNTATGCSIRSTSIRSN